MMLVRACCAIGLSTGAALSVSHLASAQAGGSLVGRVVDASGTRVGGADVSVRGTALRTTTSDSGLFRLAIGAGPHVVTIRRMGYAEIFDSVDVLSEGVTHRDFVLGSRMALLDTMTITKPLSASMRAFEDRRKHRQGAFITSGELRAMDERPIRSLMSRHLPGVRFVTYRSGLYLSSSRGSGSIDRRMLIRAIPSDLRSPTGCWVQVYMDGTRMYTPNGRADAVNLNEFQTRDLEAIEFYSGASTPPEFSSSWGVCGTLVLWTRLP